MVEGVARRAADLRDSLRLALGDLDRLAERVASVRPRIAPGAGDLELYGAGALAHGYYTHLERFLERIARDLDGAPTEGPDWHRRLVLAMTLDRAGTRPPLFDRALADRLDDLLRFRHLFRNLYVLDLDVNRVGEVLDRIGEVHPVVVGALGRFADFLARVEAAG